MVSSALTSLPRLDALRRSKLLESPPEEAFDRLTRLASSALGVPISLVSLVDADRQFFKSCIGLPEPWATERETPLSHSFCQHVLDTSSPLVVTDAREHPLLKDSLAIRDLGVVSYAGFPLLAPSGEVLGSLCAIDTEPREWGSRDLEVLRDLAATATTEIRLRLLAEEAADAVLRLMRLEAITDAALSHLALDDLLAQMLERVVAALEVDTAAVLLAEGDELAVRCTIGLDQAVEDEIRVPIGEGFAGRVAVERRPLAIEDLTGFDVVSPVLRRSGLVSMLGVPLMVDGDTVGVLHVGSLATRRFSERDTDLLRLAGDRVARGITQARMFEREQQIAQTLQSSMLPERIPAIPGLATAVRYLPAERATHVGGDWYDVFSLADSSAGVSVGDIAGHGVRAAAEMWRIRSALQAHTFECRDPAKALDRLDRLLVGGPAAPMATAVAMILDATGERAELARAGHPPPVLLRPGCMPVVLDEHGGPPLGVFGAPERPAPQAVDFPVGSTLVIYTDGLVERRDEHIDESIGRLVRAAADGPQHVEALSDHILERMLRGRPPTDDIALLVVRNSHGE